MPPEIDETIPSILSGDFPAGGGGEDEGEEEPRRRRRRAAPSDADRDALEVPTPEPGADEDDDEEEPAPTKSGKKKGAEVEPESDDETEPDDDDDEPEETVESLKAKIRKLEGENTKRRKTTQKKTAEETRLSREVEQIRKELAETRRLADPEPDKDENPDAHVKWTERRGAEKAKHDADVQTAVTRLSAQIELVRDRHDGEDGLPAYDAVVNRWRDEIAGDKKLHDRVLAAQNQAKELYQIALEFEDQDRDDDESYVALYKELYKGGPRRRSKQEREEEAVSARRAAGGAPRKGARFASGGESGESSTSDTDFKKAQRMFPGMYKTKAQFDKAVGLNNRIKEKRIQEGG